MISKALINILTADTDLTAIIGTRISPIIDIPEQSADLLSAIYYSVQMFPETAKNGPVANNHVVTFLTIAKGYETSWNIALKLRDALEMKTGEFKNITFRLPRCKSIEDEYEFTPINMYGHKITFNIRTAYY